MFSLHDIDTQIRCFNMVVEDLESKAEAEDYPIRQLALRCTADGFRQARMCLERMIANAIEDEAREAMRRAS